MAAHLLEAETTAGTHSGKATLLRQDAGTETSQGIAIVDAAFRGFLDEFYHVARNAAPSSRATSTYFRKDILGALVKSGFLIENKTGASSEFLSNREKVFTV